LATTRSKGRTKRNGQATAKKIEGLVDGIVSSAKAKKDPSIDIPLRTLSNARFDPKRRIIEMGSAKQERAFFNMSQAKSFMQTVLIASGCKQLIDQDKTVSIRGLYYFTKHTIPDTNEKTFNDQDESDPIIEDLEVALGALREELHVFASTRGTIAGNLTIVSKADTIDLRRMGSCEPDVLQFRKCEADFVLHVEKDTVWQRFNEDKFWKSNNCILTHGNGQPPRGVRRLLYRLHNELKLPVYVLLDNDPWGYYIYSVIKQGSINLAFESKRMAVPEAKFIGLRSADFEEFGLTDDAKLAIDDKDIKRAKQILGYPWFAGKKEWEKEVALMLKHGFKMEVESLINKSVSFVTETYVPQKLRSPKLWLD
jgi:DNA topoisomerase-6 subunit A